MSDRYLGIVLGVIVAVWAVESIASVFIPAAHPDGALVAGIGAVLGAFAAYITRRARGSGPPTPPPPS